MLQYEADHEIIQGASELISAQYIEFASTPVLGIFKMFLRSRGLWPRDIQPGSINSMLQTVILGKASSDGGSNHGVSTSARLMAIVLSIQVDHLVVRH